MVFFLLTKEIIGKMHVWLINELLDSEFLDTIFQPEYLQKALFVVVLDFTKVFCLFTNNY